MAFGDFISTLCFIQFTKVRRLKLASKSFLQSFSLLSPMHSHRLLQMVSCLRVKALRCGLCCHAFLDIDDLITSGKRLFGLISSKTHCLHYLFSHRNVASALCTASSLRTRAHNFTHPCTDFNLYKNYFINRCLFHFL